MFARKQVARGFTLVEILIVVVILGILAAIVIPQFTSASESAKSSSLVSQLQTIRSQIELYQIQHNGDYPTLAQLTPDADGDGNHDWTNLTTETEVDGSAGDATGDEFGPYLQQPPTNSFELTTNVVADGNAASGVGWTYDEDTGEVKASMLVTKATDLNMDVQNNVETYAAAP
jgi:general secretion pathway protein G